MNKKIKKILNKKNKTKIVCLTAYSKSISKILDKYPKSDYKQSLQKLLSYTIKRDI